MLTKTRAKTKTKASTAGKKKKPLTKAQKTAREIARRNRTFAAASPAEKRVLIAKDVIAQIKAKRYEARTGTWVTLHAPGDDYVIARATYSSDDSIRELFFKEKITGCDCCALGAMFMSCTLYNNKTTVDDFDEEIDRGSFDTFVSEKGSLSNGLNTFFSPEQLTLIEAAFECNEGAMRAPERQTKAVRRWYDAMPDDEERMIAIMQNIIDNKGTFVP